MPGVAYGVRLEGDLALDELPQAIGEQLSLRVEVRRTPSLPAVTGILISTYQAQERTAQFFIHPEHAVILLDELISFELRFEKSLIICYCRPDASDALIKYWVLQQILPMFLLLAGTLDFLHGTATSLRIFTGNKAQVEPADVGCIAFLGPSRSGKSTLLNYFLSRGHGLVTDDHLALASNEYTQVMPAIPYHRPYRAIEDLGILSDQYSPAPTRLKRLYALWPVAAEAPIKAELMSGADAMAVLIADNHYTLHDSGVPRFVSLFEKRFRGLAALSRRIPVVKLHVPRSMERLTELYTFILHDLASESL